MTEEQLKELERLASASMGDGVDLHWFATEDFARDGWASSDAEYLARAGNSVPALVAEVRRARNERDAARAWRREAESVQRTLMDEKAGIRAELKEVREERDAARRGLDEQHIAVRRSLEHAEAAEAQCAAMREVLEDVKAVISESHGVAGYHLNGAVAEWEIFDFEIDAALAPDAGRKLIAQVAALRQALAEVRLLGAFEARHHAFGAPPPSDESRRRVAALADAALAPNAGAALLARLADAERERDDAVGVFREAMERRIDTTVATIAAQRDEALAQCAAMREALERVQDIEVANTYVPFDFVRAALAPNAGAALLERVRLLEAVAAGVRIYVHDARWRLSESCPMLAAIDALDAALDAKKGEPR